MQNVIYCPLCPLSDELEKQSPPPSQVRRKGGMGMRQESRKAESNLKVLITFKEFDLCQAPSLKDATSFHFQGKLCVSLVP